MLKKPALIASVFVLAAITVAGLAYEAGQGESAYPAIGTVQVAFTPEQDATHLIVVALRQAKTSAYVQAFSFTSNEIAFALIEAKQRGVDVQVIADGEQMRRLDHNKLALMQRAGVQVWLDEQHQSAHNKVIVIDAHGASPVVITGSMNFTYSGQFKNAENVLILRGNPALTEAYRTNWQRHRNHALPYRP